MIAERLLHSCSKLATTRVWHSTTLAEELSIKDATEDDLYEAIDWLLERQARIENKLAKCHLSEGSLVLYDISTDPPVIRQILEHRGLWVQKPSRDPPNRESLPESRKFLLPT